MSDSFFIVLEGMDGSGKTYISHRLTDLLKAALSPEQVEHTYEPHNESAAGAYIRDVLGKRITISARTLALAYALNRADHNERMIVPFLDGGDQRVLVCDRYYHSLLVYQSTDGVTIDELLDLSQTARVPDLTLFLDASPETSEARIGKRKGERELFEERFAETRAKYFSVIELLRARGERIEVVDANGSVVEVLNGVIDVLGKYAPAWLRLEKIVLE
jgi:dTMP kinase